MSERNQSGIKGREEGSGWQWVGWGGGEGAFVVRNMFVGTTTLGPFISRAENLLPDSHLRFFFLCVRLSGRFDPMAAQRRIGRDLRPPARCWRNRRRKFGGIFLLLHPHPPPVNVFISADRWKWPFDPHLQVGP